MFEQGILLSQLIALISITHETNKIQTCDGDIAWRGSPFKFEGKGHHSLSIKWERGSCCGSENPHLCMTLDRMDMKYDRYPRAIFHAFYYNGDNCNEKTRFLYQIMAEETDIIDDLGIVGHCREIGKTYLTKLSPAKYFRMQVNARGKAIEYYKGNWVYADKGAEE